MNSSNNEPEQVYMAFAHTVYGKHLNKVARYNRFRPTDYPVKYWARLLGPDANNLRHMRQTIKVARWFVKTENASRSGVFTYRDALLLGVTAALHDQAESIVGDIPYGHKTNSRRSKEIKVLRSNEKAFEPLLKGASLKIYRFGRDKIAFSNPAKRLPGAFKTIELLGFTENALHADHQVIRLKGLMVQKKAAYFGINNEDSRKQVIMALERLSAEVLGSGVIERLIDFSVRFPSARTYLVRHKGQIQQGFNSVETSTFDWYEIDDPYAQPGERERRIEKFQHQQDVWNKWQAVAA